VFTTTKTRVHPENETRLLSLTTDDSSEQTARVLLGLANEDEVDDDGLDQWHQLQDWLRDAEHRVTIPFAATLAEAVPPVAVRLRRDFGSILALIRAHAMLQQRTRPRTSDGRIVATLDDYETVRRLVVDIISSGVEATVPSVVRETVDAIGALATQDGATVRALAAKLNLDRSRVNRRLKMAADAGYVRNLEERRGRPGRWVVGDPMPEDRDILPEAHTLEQHTDSETAGGEGVCADAPGFEGVRSDEPTSWVGTPGLTETEFVFGGGDDQ
jgi:hypothetical protein